MLSSQAATSEASKALSSESMGTACRTFLKAVAGAAPTLREGPVRAHQVGVHLLDGVVPSSQRIVGGIADFRPVVLVIKPVVVGYESCKFPQLIRRFGTSQFLHRFVEQSSTISGHLIHTGFIQFNRPTHTAAREAEKRQPFFRVRPGCRPFVDFNAWPHGDTGTDRSRCPGPPTSPALSAMISA